MDAITTTTGYELVETDRLLDDIKKQSRRARTKGEEMIQSMKTAGLMLIELKARTKHGFFMLHASSSTGLHERTIQRYMEMAKGVPPLKTVISRERVKGKGDTLLLIKATEFLPEESTPKPDTVSGLSENDSTPPPPIETDIVPDSRPPSKGITLDAVIVEKEDHQEDEPTAPEAQVDVDDVDDVDEAARLANAEHRIEDGRQRAYQVVLEALPLLSKAQITQLLEILNTRWT